MDNDDLLKADNFSSIGEMDRDLVERKAEEKWGSGIIEQVSLNLQNEFPEVRGFSIRNLWNMKKWYLSYASSENRKKTVPT